MSEITLKNIENSKNIMLDLKLKTLKSSGHEIYIQDSAVFTILHKLFTTQDTTLTYNDIANIVRDQKSFFHMEDSPDSIIANKYVFKVRSLLKVFIKDDLILTLRGFGYRVSNKWLPITEDKSSSEIKNSFLGEITTIIEDCIIYCESVNIIHDASGLSYIKPEQDIVINNFKRINSCYHKFLSCYSLPGNCIELLELREKILKVLLYVIYWRVGDSLTDDKFKSDYKNELNVILRQINQIITLLD